eukprot:361177-Chlamydomonas_euryale.AAC.3
MQQAHAAASTPAALCGHNAGARGVCSAISNATLGRQRSCRGRRSDGVSTSARVSGEHARHLGGWPIHMQRGEAAGLCEERASHMGNGPRQEGKAGLEGLLRSMDHVGRGPRPGQRDRKSGGVIDALGPMSRCQGTHKHQWVTDVGGALVVAILSLGKLGSVRLRFQRTAFDCPKHARIRPWHSGVTLVALGPSAPSGNPGHLVNRGPTRQSIPSPIIPSPAIPSPVIPSPIIPSPIIPSPVRLRHRHRATVLLPSLPLPCAYDTDTEQQSWRALLCAAPQSSKYDGGWGGGVTAGVHGGSSVVWG